MFYGLLKTMILRITQKGECESLILIVVLLYWLHFAKKLIRQNDVVLTLMLIVMSLFWSRGYKTFSMFNSAEHKFFPTVVSILTFMNRKIAF